jgi:hypothetical protein
MPASLVKEKIEIYFSSVTVRTGYPPPVIFHSRTLSYFLPLLIHVLSLHPWSFPFDLSCCSVSYHKLHSVPFCFLTLLIFLPKLASATLFFEYVFGFDIFFQEICIRDSDSQGSPNLVSRSGEISTKYL